MWILIAWINVAGVWKSYPMTTFSVQHDCTQEALRINADYLLERDTSMTGAYCEPK